MISSDELWDWYEQDQVTDIYMYEDNCNLRSLSLYNRKVGELEMLKEQKELHRRWYNHHTAYVAPNDFDKAFDMSNPSCIYYSCYDDHYMYEEGLRNDKLVNEALEWHHINPVTEDWMLAEANKIDRLLKEI